MKSKWPVYTVNEIKKVLKVIKSNKVYYWTGEEGQKFETEFSKYFGLKFQKANVPFSIGEFITCLNVEYF